MIGENKKSEPGLLLRPPGKGLGESESEEDGELWIYSYADLITLLLGFFIILQSFSVLNIEQFKAVANEIVNATDGETKDQGKKQVTVAQQARALRLLLSMMHVESSVDEAVEHIENQFAKKGENTAVVDMPGGIDLKAARKDYMQSQDQSNTIDLAMPETILFAPGSANLLAEAETGIKTLAEEINKLSNVSAIEIVGHTDSTIGPNGTFKDNFSLSSARAGAVAMLLINNAVPRDILLVRGMADLDPLLPETNADGSINAEHRARNRRVQIIVKKSKTQASHD